jgi:uncharacterized cupredoxin-like copper-binding protein
MMKNGMGEYRYSIHRNNKNINTEQKKTEEKPGESKELSWSDTGAGESARA